MTIVGEEGGVGLWMKGLFLTRQEARGSSIAYGASWLGCGQPGSAGAVLEWRIAAMACIPTDPKWSVFFSLSRDCCLQKHQGWHLSEASSTMIMTKCTIYSLVPSLVTAISTV